MSDELSTVCMDIKKDQASWKAWFDFETPETEEMPAVANKVLTPMQQLCVIRCYRADRAYNAVKLFILKTMGEFFVQPPVLDYKRVYRQSTPLSPMVFVLSPGADPQNDIQLLAEELVWTKNSDFWLWNMESKAEALIERVMRRAIGSCFRIATCWSGGLRIWKRISSRGRPRTRISVYG